MLNLQSLDRFFLQMASPLGTTVDEALLFFLFPFLGTGTTSPMSPSGTQLDGFLHDLLPQRDITVPKHPIALPTR